MFGGLHRLNHPLDEARRFGQRLEVALNEIRAIDDHSFEFRLKRPFPLLTSALGKPTSNVCFIMHERVVRTDAYKQIDDYTGSGPFRFLRSEWVPSASAAFARNTAYLPRQEKANFVSDGKMAYFDRIEWKVITDPTTCAAAMQNHEMDWWQTPTPDLLPSLHKARGVSVDLLDNIGTVAVMRFNLLHPPFNNLKLRPAILPAIDQADFMAAAFGIETSLFAVNVGVFTPGSPPANTARLEVLTGPRDFAKAKRLVAESGYKGERVGFLAPTDYLILKAYRKVGADLLQRLVFKSEDGRSTRRLVRCTRWGEPEEDRRADPDVGLEGGPPIIRSAKASSRSRGRTPSPTSCARRSRCSGMRNNRPNKLSLQAQPYPSLKGIKSDRSSFYSGRAVTGMSGTIATVGEPYQAKF